MTLRRNVGWNVVEVVVSSLVLFLVFKLIVAQLGVTSLGVWSLVLSVTSIARVADVGAAAGLSRYVGIARVAKDAEADRDALRYVRTAFGVNGLLYVILALLIWWPAWKALPLVTHGSDLVEARALLPYAVASFAMLNVASVATIALIGLGRGERKSMLTLGATAVQAVVAIAAIGRFGLVGVAMGQIAQYLVLTIGGWLLIRRELRMAASGWSPFAIDRAALREMLGFGARLQGLNIVAFLFEPLVKIAISSTAGLATLGLYELASRTILQVRQVVVTPTQNLTPIYAASFASDRAALDRTYQQTSSVTIAIAAIMMGAIFVGSPVLSLIWLGRIDPSFVAYSMLLSVGWFGNIAASPAYLLGVATGVLRWNIVAAGILSFGCPIFVLALHRLGATALTVPAIAVSVLVGGIVMLRGNARAVEVAVLPGRAVWRDIWNALRTRLGLRPPPVSREVP